MHKTQTYKHSDSIESQPERMHKIKHQLILRKPKFEAHVVLNKIQYNTLTENQSNKLRPNRE